MNAATISPLTSSGLATTAASTIYGCSRSTLSTSKGLILYPEDVMISSDLPTNQKYPSLSLVAVSPVKYHPFLKTSDVFFDLDNIL